MQILLIPVCCLLCNTVVFSGAGASDIALTFFWLAAIRLLKFYVPGDQLRRAEHESTLGEF